MLPLQCLPRPFDGPLLRSEVAFAVALDYLAPAFCGVGDALLAHSCAAG